ncbi:MAG: Calx-beta domain-containing protein, partial [Bdellovibrionota bacterium]
MSAVSALDVTINLATSGTATGGGTDYNQSATSISILAGNTTGSVTVTSVDDGLDEVNETVIIDIDTVVNATESGVQQATTSITDDDNAPDVTLAVDNANIAENGGVATFTATLSAATSQNVTINLATSGTATGGGTDYNQSATSISILAGNTTGSVTVTGVNDALDEAGETVIIDIDTVTNANESTPQQATTTITDDDATPTVDFTSASQASAGESGTLTITAQLSAISGQDIDVPFTLSGTAIDPDDYAITASPITITAGNTSADITITIAADILDENDETVIVTMGVPTNASAGTVTVHTATITDDDATPTVTLAVDNASIAENGGVATFTATLSTASGQDVTINLATSGTATGGGTDYNQSATSITILAGNTTGSVTVTGVDDAIDEANETVIIDIDSVTNAIESGVQQATTTITDDETAPNVTLTVDTATIAESVAIATFTATLDAVSGQDVTINFSTSGTATGGGTDYTQSASSIVILAGNTTGSITVTSVDDLLDENNETVIIDIATVTNAVESGVQQETITILDDDATPTVDFTSASQASVGESGTLTVTAQLSAASGLDVDVPFTLSGTAIDPDDYSITASPITISAGSTTADITITIAADTLDENNETVIVTMGVPTNASAGTVTVHTATITDDDATPTVTLAVDNANIVENGGVATFTATLSAASGLDVTVNLATSGTATGSGTDYNQSGSSISILAGNTTGSITVTSVNDALDENNETVIVDIDTVVNATESGVQQATTSITDDDAAPTVSWTTASQASVGESGTLTITAQLSAASGLDVTIPYSVNGSSTATNPDDYAITASPITILAGSSTANITITIASDTIDESDETVIVNMGIPTNATQGATTTHTATIIDDDATPTVDFTSASQASVGESGTLTITAQLSAVSGQNVTVPFTLSGTAIDPDDYSITASPITISAGSTTADITITIAADTVDESDETVIITMGVPTNASAGTVTVHTATITDDDATPTVTLTADTNTIAESSGVATLTATLSNASAQNVTVNYSFSGTATGGGIDYTASAASVVILAGNTTGSITMTADQDLLDENDETVIVDIDTVVNATESGVQQETITITDDDATPTVSFIAAAQSSAGESGTVVVTLQLSAASALDVDIPFSIDGASTANDPADYSITASPVSILAGNTSTTITINIVNDAISEADETVIINMGVPTNATQGAITTNTVTITEDDALPTVNFTTSSQTSAGESGNMTITAQLDAVSASNVTIPFTLSGTATNPADYSITASPITITAGNTTADITITIASDTLDESNETVIVTMGAPVNAIAGVTTVHTATILDDDATPTVSFTSASQASVGESGTLTVTAQLSATSGLDVDVPFTLSGTAIDPDDYSITASPITITAGNTTADITITIASDTLDESNETVIVTMGVPTNASAGATTVHTATITDDDAAPTVNWTSSSQSSGGEAGTMTITAQLDAVSGQNVTVNFSYSGTATNPADYNATSSPIVIPAGSTSANVTITIAADTLDENNETVIATIGSATNATVGATNVHTATIVDDDATPTVSFITASQTTAESGTVDVTLQLSAISGLDVDIPFTINLASTAGNPGDYSITASPATITAGSTTTNITLTIVSDATPELDETVIIDMGVPTNATQGAITTNTVTISEGYTPPTVDFTSASQSSIGESGTLTITAQLSAVAALDVDVPFTLSGTAIDPDDYSITASPITITAGNTTADITITIAADTLDENDETVIVTMGAPTNASAGTVTVHTATIVDDDATPTVQFTSASQTSTDETDVLTITAQLSAASGLPVSVPFTINGASTAIDPDDYSITASPVIIPAGSTTVDITVTLADDSIDENNETIIVDMGAPTNATQGVQIDHTITILDDDATPTVDFTSASQNSAGESGTLTITAQLSAASGLDVDVPFTLSGTAANPADYTITASPITITAGSTTADITITIVSDVVDENDETVIVTMGAPTNASAG